MKDLQIQPNQKVYKFQFIRKLGGGAFGEVWQAYDSFIDKLAAVKVLAGDSPVDARLFEAKIGSKLKHDNLVNVHYAETLNCYGKDYVFIVMDYLSDGSIATKLNSCNFLPLQHTLSYIRNVLCGLEYLHEMNFYHNDIKPQNILIGKSGQAVLSDYGITCCSPTGGITSSHGFYKLHAAPETLDSNIVCVQTDIYQVGLTMLRLLNGIGYLADKFSALGESAYNDLVSKGKLISDKDFLPYIPTAVKTVIKKATAHDATARYQSALEMRRALEKLTFPGYWTSDETGKLIGYKGNDQYFYKEEQLSEHIYNFVAKKRNQKSLRETKVMAFCKNNLTKSELEKQKNKFIHEVVEK